VRTRVPLLLSVCVCFLRYNRCRLRLILSSRRCIRSLFSRRATTTTTTRAKVSIIIIIRCAPNSCSRILLHLISLARREQVREGLALRDVVGILFQTFPEQFHRSGARIRSRVHRRARRWCSSTFRCVVVRFVMNRAGTHDRVCCSVAYSRPSPPHHALPNHARHPAEQRRSALR
jgi:hypothetical protein